MLGITRLVGNSDMQGARLQSPKNGVLLNQLILRFVRTKGRGEAHFNDLIFGEDARIVPGLQSEPSDCGVCKRLAGAHRAMTC